MGVLDFRKTWRFSVGATADQCFSEAFVHAMSKTGVGPGAIKWRLEQGSSPGPIPGRPAWPASVASVTGRAGVGILRGLFNPGGDEAMIGTQMTFAVNPESPRGRTECSLWLSKRASGWDIPMADVLVLQGYMSDVERQLRAIDPGSETQKV